jgi:hypothetical protein
MSLLTVHKFYGNTGEHTSQSQNILSTCALNNSPVLIQGCQPRKFLISYTLSLQIHSYQPYVHCKRKYFLFLTFTHHFFDFLFKKSVFSLSQFVSGALCNLAHKEKKKKIQLRSLKMFIYSDHSVSLQHSVWHLDNPWLFKTVFSWHSGSH